MPPPVAERAAAGRGATAPPVLAPRAGYDRAAPCFDEWRWSRFWREHEAPWVHEWIASLGGAAAPGRRALDVGCGTGGYLRRLADARPLAVGVDVSIGMLQAARRRAPKALMLQASAEALPLTDASFDAVLAARMLSHVAEPSRVLAELSRVSRRGARLLLTDVHPEHPYTHTRLPSPDGLIAIDTYHHPLDLLRSALRTAGFSVASLHTFTRSQLRRAPDATLFPKLYRGDVPVFYVLQATRRALVPMHRALAAHRTGAATAPA